MNASQKTTKADDIPPFDALWMGLYIKQGQLCVDQRPAVRKSAGQTLFSTISAHGGLLQTGTWKKVVWQVGDKDYLLYRVIFNPIFLYTTFYTGKQFSPVLDSPKHDCVML